MFLTLENHFVRKNFKKLWFLALRQQCGFPKLHFFWILAQYASFYCIAARSDVICLPKVIRQLYKNKHKEDVDYNLWRGKTWAFLALEKQPIRWLFLTISQCSKIRKKRCNWCNLGKFQIERKQSRRCMSEESDEEKKIKKCWFQPLR